MAPTQKMPLSIDSSLSRLESCTAHSRWPLPAESEISLLKVEIRFIGIASSNDRRSTVSASQFFSQAPHWTSRQCGRPLTFGLASGVVLVWALTGPLFNYSDTWQLVINTGTAIITFLMVFLIQNTQNRDASAVQLKLESKRIPTDSRTRADGYTPSFSMTPRPTRLRPMGSTPSAGTRVVRRWQQKITFSRRIRGGEGGHYRRTSSRLRSSH
jgi:Low affinity iron permease